MTEVRLKRLCSTINRGSTPNYAQGETGDALVVGQSCQRPGGSFDIGRARWHDGPLPSKGLLRGGEVVVNSTGTGTLGRSALVPDVAQPTFADTHVTVLRPRPSELDGRFLAYLVGRRSFVVLAEDALSVGATKQRELNVEALRNYAVAPLPALDRQHLIADFLDRETGRIGSASSSVLSVGQQLSSTERAIADRAVTGAGSVPLKAIATIYSGVTLNQAKVPEDAVDVPYLRVANVKAGWLDLEEIKQVPVPVTDIERLRLHDGDLLLTEGGDLDKLGRGALWESQLPLCVFQNHVFAVRPREGVADARFLSWVTRSSAARTYFESTASRITNIASTNKAKLGRWPVPNLPLDEQVRRVEGAEAAWAEARRAISAARQVYELLGEYRDSLIHEAVTGKLDVTQMSEQQMEERLHAAREGRLDEVTA